MTQPPATPVPDRTVPARRATGRIGIVVTMIASLIVAAFTRHSASEFQNNHSPRARRTTAGGTSLAGMDTYALALLLGGLRGPLVMVLWAQSENQKADRNLEGLDTQIDWIRRLQPEFDTVHVFQIWNKAYNISVQMVGLANKYTTILDALEYGKNIDAERPDNLNLVREIGRIYSDKLASANPEKIYYRNRVRRETMYRDPSETSGRGGAGLQRSIHESILDQAGNVRPEFLKPRFLVDSSTPAGEEVYDGSELQFLPRYQPFPYGVTPNALGFSYHKRAQLLLRQGQQKPLQISPSVIDAQPALVLKSWSEEEWERGRRLELQAFGEKAPTERLQMEMPAAGMAVATPFKDSSVLPEVLYSYDMVVRLTNDSIVEYERHLASPEYATKRQMYASHMDGLLGSRELCAGDAAYLRGMQTTGEDRSKHLASAAQHYLESIRYNGITGIRYYTADRYTVGVCFRRE